MNPLQYAQKAILINEFSGSESQAMSKAIAQFVCSA